MEEEEEDADREDDEMSAARNDFFLWFIAIAAAVTTIALDYDYLTSVPLPIIPDLRFSLHNLGTGLTLGLQSEHLFRFSETQLLILVNVLRIPAIL